MPKKKTITIDAKQLREISAELNGLLGSSATTESMMHDFLTKHAFLLIDRYYSDLIITKPKAISKVLDFAIFENTGNYSNWHFVEMKSPNERVIVQNRGCRYFSNAVSQAIGQIKQFKSEIDSAQGLLSRRYPFLRFSFYSLIIGRSREMTDEERTFLKDMNASLAEIRVRTYDSIKFKADLLASKENFSPGIVRALSYAEYLSHISSAESAENWYRTQQRRQMSENARIAQDGWSLYGALEDISKGSISDWLLNSVILHKLIRAGLVTISEAGVPEITHLGEEFLNE